MATCHDGEGMKWMMGYMKGEAPVMEPQAFMWSFTVTLVKTRLKPAFSTKQTLIRVNELLVNRLSQAHT